MIVSTRTIENVMLTLVVLGFMTLAVVFFSHGYDGPGVVFFGAGLFSINGLAGRK